MSLCYVPPPLPIAHILLESVQAYPGLIVLRVTEKSVPISPHGVISRMFSSLSDYDGISCAYGGIIWLY
jgi:hypothetical protein